MNNKIIAVAAVLILAAFSIWFYLSQSRNQQPASGGLIKSAYDAQNQQFETLKLFPKTKRFTGYQLTDQEGQTFDHTKFDGNWSLVFFGFTHCPDICPTTLLDMQRIDKKMKQQGIKPPQFVFISVDPERDTPEKLKTYIEYFNPEFVAATGDAGNILSISSQLGAAFAVEEHQEGQEFYNVDHSAALFLINPDGERAGIFNTPHQVDLISSDLIKLIQSS